MLSILKYHMYFKPKMFPYTSPLPPISPCPNQKRIIFLPTVAVVDRFDCNLRKLSLAEMFCVATTGILLGRDRPIAIQFCK